jgi:hypothetical protein
VASGRDTTTACAGAPRSGIPIHAPTIATATMTAKTGRLGTRFTGGDGAT